MVIIEKLSDRISEEISDAKDYAKMAIEYRADYPDLARVLYGISLEEMGHMEKLHAGVSDVIERYKETHGDPPPEMLAVYNYLHKHQIDKAAEARAMQAMYKDG